MNEIVDILLNKHFYALYYIMQLYLSRVAVFSINRIKNISIKISYWYFFLSKYGNLSALQIIFLMKIFKLNSIVYKIYNTCWIKNLKQQ